MVELGQKLLAYEKRQSELVDLLREAGVEAGITDKDTEGKRIPLVEIDPFTFVAQIHKYRDWHNRLPILAKLKSRLGVTAEVPRDFEGVPIPNPQKSWFFSFKAEREPSAIPQLWEFSRGVMANSVTPDAFARTLALPQVGKAKLTQAMFWLNPEHYLPIDSQTRPHLENAGIQPEFDDYAGYQRVLAQTHAKFPGKKFWELSYDAWWANQPPPSDTSRPLKYWLCAPGRDASQWEEFYARGIIAIGWDDLGDLRKYADKTGIAKALRKLENEPDSSKKNDATACYSFAHDMQVGDVVFAKQGGSRILGHGVVESDYEFDDSREAYKHVRRVKWLKKGDWQVGEDSHFALKTLTDVSGYPDFVKKLETLVGGLPLPTPPPSPTGTSYWWLNCNPRIWDIVAPPVGSTQTYTAVNADGNKRRVYKYFTQVKPGDLIVGYAASPVRKVVALCRVTKALHTSDEGEVFEFEKTRDFASPVSLQALREVPELKQCESLANNQGSLFRLTPAEYETILGMLEEAGEPTRGADRVAPYPIEQCAAETYLPVDLLQLWVEAIRRKQQAIIYGPPGTGKTYLAERLARRLVGGGDGFIDLVQFHPAYSYEDFIQGIRPETTENSQVTYDLAPGRFLEFCQKAKGRQGICVLIIDEINRANLARVFGELMYLLEYRMRSVPLAGGGTLSVPANVRIIGTMNTADRSIALVDFALRRRFAFLELAPDFNVLTQFQEKQGFDPGGLIAVLRDINTAIADKNFSLGVSFFLVPDLPKQVQQIWRMEIETYLEEYFFAQKDTADKFRWAQVKDRILHG
jgi:5-methylcytosine-specific restriction protein B